jgi:hypothetical protein
VATSQYTAELYFASYFVFTCCQFHGTTTYATFFDTVIWEGDEAIEEDDDDESNIVARRQAALKANKMVSVSEPMFNAEESEESSGSEDEYVEDKEGRLSKVETTDKVRFTALFFIYLVAYGPFIFCGVQRRGRLNRSSVTSDSDSANEPGKRRLSRHKFSASPSPSGQGQLKRKATNATRSSSPPLPKRKKSGDPADDPARKYCLGKLEELFKDVFLRYPHVRILVSDDIDKTNDMEIGERQPATKLVSKNLEDLSDEEKEALLEESRQFSRDLENCVFEIYSEPDKSGHPHAGGKYKYVSTNHFRRIYTNLF